MATNEDLIKYLDSGLKEGSIVKAEFEDQARQMHEHFEREKIERERLQELEKFRNPPGRIERMNVRRRLIQTTVTGPGDGSTFMPRVTLWERKDLKDEMHYQVKCANPVLVKFQWDNADEARAFAQNLLDACDRSDKLENV